MAASRWIASIVCLALVDAAPALGADTFQVPARRAGCWEHTTVQGLFGKAGVDGSTYECIDAASEQARLQAQPAVEGNCSQGPVPGTSLAWDQICTDGATTAKMRMEVSGDFQSAYSMSIVSRTTRPGAAPRVSKVVANAKWISSACPAPLAPGSWLVLGGFACTPDGSGN